MVSRSMSIGIVNGEIIHKQTEWEWNTYTTNIETQIHTNGSLAPTKHNDSVPFAPSDFCSDDSRFLSSPIDQMWNEISATITNYYKYNSCIGKPRILLLSWMWFEAVSSFSHSIGRKIAIRGSLAIVVVVVVTFRIAIAIDNKPYQIDPMEPMKMAMLTRACYFKRPAQVQL